MSSSELSSRYSYIINWGARFRIDSDYGDLFYGMKFSSPVSAVYVLVGDCVVGRWSFEEPILSFSLEEPVSTRTRLPLDVMVDTADSTIEITIKYGILEHSSVILPTIVDRRCDQGVLTFDSKENILCVEENRWFMLRLLKSGERVPNKTGHTYRVEGNEYVFCNTGVKWSNVTITSVRPLDLVLTSDSQVIGTVVENEIDKRCYSESTGVLFQYTVKAPPAFGPVNSEHPIVLTNRNSSVPSFVVTFQEEDVEPIQDGQYRHIDTVINGREAVLRFTARGPIGVGLIE